MQKFTTTLFFSFLISFAFSQTLLRGPYLQKQTATSINVKWRTDTTTNSRVYYGTSLSNLSQSVFIADTVRDHDILVSGLQPYTKYFYKIESNNTVLSGPDSNHHFMTAPIPGTVQPIRVWSIGDFGKASDCERETRNSYLNYSAGKPTDVWLWVGDNAYNDGTDQEFQDKVFTGPNAFGEVFKNMHFYPCPGNHDYNSICPVPCGQDPYTHVGPYYSIVTVPTQAEAGGVASTLENYYSFDYGNAHFISLNSELGSQNINFDWSGVYTAGDTSSPMLKWLKQDLQTNTKQWVIAYWHQPPYSKGSHNSDNTWEIYMKAVRQKWLPILESYGVDIVLNGHSHVYERSYLIKGHYGLSSTFDPALHLVNGTSGNESLGESYIKYTDGPNPNKGTVYINSGNAGSGDSNPPLLTAQHPVMFFSDGGDNVCGSFMMDINDNKLTGKYLSIDGTIKDQFTIQKQSITGIEKGYDFFKNVKNVTVTPNPFISKASIKYELTQPSQMSIDIYSQDGKYAFKVFSGKQNEGKQEITLDSEIFNLASGHYVLKITDGNSTGYEKLIKVN